MDRTGDNRMCHTLIAYIKSSVLAFKRRCVIRTHSVATPHSNMHRVGSIGLLLLLCISTGCQTLSLPAIDPTGNRIFANNFTRVVNPHDPNNGYPSTQSAFPNPPEPPPCMQGTNGKDGKLCKGCLAGKGCLARKKEAEDVRGRCGQLLLTPTRIVAPVGGEVILLAGVCGKDEYLVTNEPIEWMLSPQSVGEFLEVGDDAKGQRRSKWHKDDSPKVEKLDVDFARGRTSKEAGRITRGTSNPADDLPIRKGQTWISLTSSSEGVSKVTALAPDSDVWDKRRQTATIYWVDASWQLPQPQFAVSGETVRLATRVMKADGFAPAENWIVKYRINNPEFARFLPKGAQEAITTVDQSGIANVDIVNGADPNAPGPKFPFGTAIVEIEILRPQMGSLPEISVGKGTTSVTWSAPQLLLEAGGPEIGSPDQPLAYFANLRNVGDTVAENVVLTVAVPAGMRFDSANYAPENPTNNVLRWPLGPLQARNVFELRFTLVASAPLSGTVQIAATGSPNLQQNQSLLLEVQKPQVTVRLTPDVNRTRVEVGNESIFQVAVTNNGNQTINNVVLTLKSDPGLQHVVDGQNLASLEIPFINPGQSVTREAVFVVRREGELFVDAIVQALGQSIASQRASVIGLPATPKRPSVQIQISAPKADSVIPIDAKFKSEFVVINNGPVTLQNLRIILQHDPSLAPQESTQGYRYQADKQVFEWQLPALRSGDRATFEATFRGTAANPQAAIAVAVEAGDGVNDRQTVGFQIGNGPARGPSEILPGTGAGGTANKPGLQLGGDTTEPSLNVSIRPVTNAIKKGEIGTYEVRIENRGKADQRVALQLLTPEGASIVSIRAKDLKFRLTKEDRQIDFEPIQYFRANDTFSYVLQLRHTQENSGELTASVTSMSQTSPAVSRLPIQVQP